MGNVLEKVLLQFIAL